MVKLWYIPITEFHSTIKKKLVLIPNNLDESQGNYTALKQDNPKKLYAV